MWRPIQIFVERREILQKFVRLGECHERDHSGILRCQRGRGYVSVLFFSAAKVRRVAWCKVTVLTVVSIALIQTCIAILSWIVAGSLSVREFLEALLRSTAFGLLTSVIILLLGLQRDGGCLGRFGKRVIFKS